MAKISKSYIVTPPQPQGHVISEKCEEPIDELTVQVWFLYYHPNFKYCTLFVSGTELRTDGQTNKQTNGQKDRRTIQLLDAPGGPFRPGHKNGFLSSWIISFSVLDHVQNNFETCNNKALLTSRFYGLLWIWSHQFGFVASDVACNTYCYY